MARTEIMPDELYDSTRFHYTHAIIVDDTFHMSGQVATDADGNVVGGGIKTQARQAFENVGIILDEIDRGFNHIVKVTSYLVDIRENYDGFKSVYDDLFEGRPPCHTLLGVENLGSEAFLVELEVDVQLSD